MKDNWKTPPAILQRVTWTLGDWFDPCPANPKFDGLQIEWPNSDSFINPPYSRGSIERWSSKATREYMRMFKETGQPFNVIWLINYGATTNRRVIKRFASAICDLHERVAFIDPVTDEPSPGNDRDSVIYLWGWKTRDFADAFSDMGEVFVKEK